MNSQLSLSFRLILSTCSLDELQSRFQHTVPVTWRVWFKSSPDKSSNPKPLSSSRKTIDGAQFGDQLTKVLFISLRRTGSKARTKKMSCLEVQANYGSTRRLPEFDPSAGPIVRASIQHYELVAKDRSRIPVSTSQKHCSRE